MKTSKYTGKKNFSSVNTNFTKTPNELIYCTDISGNQFKLLALMFSYSNNTTFSSSNLAAKLGKSERQIQRDIDDLIKMKVIGYNNSVYTYTFITDKNVDINVNDNIEPDKSVEHPDINVNDSDKSVDINVEDVDKSVEQKPIQSLEPSTIQEPCKTILSKIEEKTIKEDKTIEDKTSKPVIEKRKFSQDIKDLLKLGNWFKEIYSRGIVYNPEILNYETGYINHIYLEYELNKNLVEGITTSDIYLIELVLNYTAIHSKILLNLTYQCQQSNCLDILNKIIDFKIENKLVDTSQLS